MGMFERGRPGGTRPRRASMATAALVVATGLLGSACLSKDQQAEATQIATTDPRLTELLADHPYTVTEVREPREPAAGGPADAVVEITFAEGFPTNDYGLDVCDIGGHDGIVTGITWLVDLDTDTVLAVTPVWGSVTCFDDI